MKSSVDFHKYGSGTTGLPGVERSEDGPPAAAGAVGWSWAAWVGPGLAVTAAGGDLPSEFVIHAVIRSEVEPVTRGNVARAWLSVLHQAQEWQFNHLSAPPLGTGAGNLALEDAAEIMATVLHAHHGSAQFPADVSFVVERPEDQQVFEAALQRAVS